MKADQAARNDRRFEVIEIPRHVSVIVQTVDKEQAYRLVVPSHLERASRDSLNDRAQPGVGNVALEFLERRSCPFDALVERTDDSVVRIDRVELDTVRIVNRVQRAADDDG